MSAERIYVTWKGKREMYESISWLSARAEAFTKFLRKHKGEDEILDDIYELVTYCIDLDRTYEKPLFGYDGLSITSDERMKLTIEGAEKKLQDFLVPYHEDLCKIFSVYRVFDVCCLDNDLSDVICAEIADRIGWKIWGNPWNSSLIDHQYMRVSMHRERNGSGKYNWYMEFRHPDLLVTDIDLDYIFDKAKKDLFGEEVNEHGKQ